MANMESLGAAETYSTPSMGCINTAGTKRSTMEHICHSFESFQSIGPEGFPGPNLIAMASNLLTVASNLRTSDYSS